MVDLSTKVFSTVGQELGKGYSERFSPRGKANLKEERDERRLRAKQRNAQLKDLQFHEESRDSRETVQEQELEVLRQQNNRVMAENAKQTAFQALERYSNSHDPKYVNNMLQDLRKNPMGKDLFPDAVRIDRVTQNDTKLLQQAGIDPELVFQNPELAQDLVKVTNNDGSVDLDSMTQVFKETGYERYASEKELERQMRQMQISTMYRDFGYKTEPERAAHREAVAAGHKFGSQEYDAAFNAAYSKFKNNNSRSEYRTQAEREALRRTQDNHGLAPGDEGFEQAYNSEFSNIKSRDRQTAPSRQQDEVEQTKDRLDETATKMGYESFFDIPVGQLKPNERARMERDVQRVERLAQADFDMDTKRRFGYIKQLLAVAEPMSEITDSETGLIDRAVNNFKAYTSDSVEGRRASSAYAAFRNTIRHALFGSALTATEVKAFNDQFGTLGQQTGPVIQQFSTSMRQLKAELENLYQVNDSYVAHFRLGMDTEHINEVIGALEERIAFFEGKAPGGDPNAPTNSGLSEERRRELDQLRNSIRSE